MLGAGDARMAKGWYGDGALGTFAAPHRPPWDPTQVLPGIARFAAGLWRCHHSLRLPLLLLI